MEPTGPTARRQTFGNSKPPSTEGASEIQTDPNAVRRKMGGSYSRYTGPGLSRGLTIEGDLVDSSGRKINTASVTGNGIAGESRAGSRMGSVGPTSRK